MVSRALAKVHPNGLMITSTFGIWASESFPRPGKRLKRLGGTIGLTNGKKLSVLSVNIFHINQKKLVENFGAYTLEGLIK